VIVAYWALATVLAVFYLYSGGKKLIQSREQLRPMMAWVDDVPVWLVRAIGALEVLGAVALVLPVLVGVAPWLALAAAVGFVLLQVGATALHLSRGERGYIGLNVGLLVAAAVLVWLATTWLE
jgi:DoxX-like protein